MSKNILICGVGGQGTVLAAKVLSQAAISNGERVLSAETIGMAQRGGSVTSHVRIGSGIFSPLIPKGGADMLIAFEASEAVRNMEYLKKDGIAIINLKAVQPTTASLSGKTFDAYKMCEAFAKRKIQTIVINADEMSRMLGSSKAVNMILLGVASKTGMISKKEIVDAIKMLVKPEFLELNQKAVEAGAGVFVLTEKSGK